MNLCLDPRIVGPWVCERTGGTWVEGRGTAIGKLDNDGKLMAGVLYEDWTGSNIVCHIAGYENWASRDYLNVIFDYPFNQLKAKRITCPIASTNIKSINLVRRMGFTLECSLAQAIPDGDLHLFRMFKDECKYIRGKYGKSQRPRNA